MKYKNRKYNVTAEKGDDCPLNVNCLTESIIYKASVIRLDSNKKETYIGLCETTFKKRFSNCKNSFHSEKNKNRTELSKFIWTLKKQTTPYNITWSIVKRCKTYNNSNKKCFLCNAEKHIIICQPHTASLKMRTELISTCRHRKKYL